MIVALVVFALPTSGTAQAPRRASSPPLQTATRALVEGKYDEVDALADKLDGRDPAVVALKARAAIERGRYAQAEAMLRPVASRAPTSEAALQLGLLQKMLGKPDAAAILSRVARAADGGTDGREIARGARALHALGEFQDANSAYRDAASRPAEAIPPSIPSGAISFARRIKTAKRSGRTKSR